MISPFSNLSIFKLFISLNTLYWTVLIFIFQEFNCILFIAYPEYMVILYVSFQQVWISGQRGRKNRRKHHKLSNNSDCISKTTGDAKSDGRWQDQRGGRDSASYWQQSQSLSPIIHGIATDTYASNSLTATKSPEISLNCKVRYTALVFVLGIQIP